MTAMFPFVDAHVFSLLPSGSDAGLSAGYSLSLVAESTTGALLSIERTAGQLGPAELPETVGEEGALMLLDEMCKGMVLLHVLVVRVILFLYAREMRGGGGTLPFTWYCSGGADPSLSAPDVTEIHV
jgi:hypothetical protein